MRTFGTLFRKRPDPEHQPTPWEIARAIVGPPPRPRHGSDRQTSSEERAARQAYNARLQAAENRQLKLAARRVSLQALNDYRAAGVQRVAIRAGCCPTCDGRAATPYRLDAVSPIPQPGCSAEVCRCQYAPVTAEAVAVTQGYGTMSRR